MSRSKTGDLIQTDRELLKHLRELGLRSVSEYRGWCATHGFRRNLDKHPRVRQREVEHAKRTAATARLAREKATRSNPEAALDAVFRGKIVDESKLGAYVDVFERIYKACRRNRRIKFRTLELLEFAARKTPLLEHGPIRENLYLSEGNTYADALAAMARLDVSWVRPLAEWRPRSHNVHRQFESLVRHLLALWPVPQFMDSVWFVENSPEAVRRQRWYVHLGRGENIRHADLPIPYTKRMAHFFMRAPNDFTADAAIRYGQVLALGGDDRLARSIAATKLGADFANNDFWVTVYTWLIAHPMLEPAQVRPLIDFIDFQRYGARAAAEGDGTRDLAPAQPNFTMRGRHPDALLRQVTAWHRRLARQDEGPALWSASGIAPFEFIEGNKEKNGHKVWTIRELLSSKALTLEGRGMRNCVASYAGMCARRHCSIWSMTLEDAEGCQKVLTIEVRNSTRLICQARRKWNEFPTDKELAVLKRWAQKSRLQLAATL